MCLIYFREEQDCFTLTKDYFGMVTGYAMIDTLDDSSKAAASIIILIKYNSKY